MYSRARKEKSDVMSENCDICPYPARAERILCRTDIHMKRIYWTYAPSQVCNIGTEEQNVGQQCRIGKVFVMKKA